MVEAVLALVALLLTVKVIAEDPLNEVEPDSPTPDVLSVKVFYKVDYTDALPADVA